MQALCFLSQTSVKISEDLKTKKSKAEMAEVEDDQVVTICEDEEDDLGVDLDSDESEDDWELGDDDEDEQCGTLYDSPLDAIDEVLYLGQHL